jgi:hypothetical protein
MKLSIHAVREWWRLPPFFFVFDVESVGLHGEPFAVGWVCVDVATGREVDLGILVSPVAEAAERTATLAAFQIVTDVEWVTAHVLPAIADIPTVSAFAMRRAFWYAWKHWELQGAMLAADVPWPCEARFLMECMRYTTWATPQAGPYPLIDVASVRLAKGFDPIATVGRLESEEPAHNPLSDARQSARLLLEALRGR